MESDMERIGYDVADKLGETAFFLLGNGIHGHVFALESGRILKVSHSEKDAALASLVVAGDVDGFGLLPAIHSVDEIGIIRGRQYYAIIREEASEVFEDLAPEEVNWIPDWRVVVDMLAYGLANQDHARIECALRWRESYMPPLEHFVSAALELERRHGIVVQDMTYSNFGISEGRLVARDWGGFRMPHMLLHKGLGGIDSRIAQPSCAP